jgi:protein O-mannosyl-transferase
VSVFDLKNFKGKPLGVICFALAAFTICLYLPVGGFEFVSYDDWHYISKNPIVGQGLTPGGIWWALTTTYFSYWHPLTWMSHMADCSLFGLHASGHHYMSVCWHALNTMLVFLLFLHLTGATWRSAFVAALFGLHPLHLESVAWLAERKDLLSTFFWLLTMFAYSLYVEQRTWKRYLLVALCLALGLMSKPMVVTLPAILLLMDFWPLNRFTFSWKSLCGLFVEKVPFFILTAGSIAITLWGTKSGGNIIDAEAFPFSLRLANVPTSYARYLGKMFWPEGLTVFYPMPKVFPAWQVIGSTVLVLVISIFALTQWRRRPYLLFGWLWFTVTLLPTINLIPVGFQSIADRYTYLSLIGVFVMLAWGAAEIFERVHLPQVAIKVAAAAALIGCAAVSWAQLPVWRNSLTLWTHSVAVTKDNAVAQHNLGYALAEVGRYSEALPYYREGLRLRPRHFDGQLNLGAALLHVQDYRGATNVLNEAIRLEPADLRAHNNLGLALMMLGRAAEATNHFALALKFNPSDPNVQVHYGLALTQLRDFKRAVNHYEEALRLDPRSWTAHFGLGKLYLTSGDLNGALDHLSRSAEINPQNVETHVLLGKALHRAGQKAFGMEELNRALKLDPQNAEAHFALALALENDRKPETALNHFREALRIKPTSAESLNDFAWVLATHANPAFRNGPEAVAMAERACEMTSHNQPLLLGTLAAAYAELGEFEKAARTAEAAGDLARSLGQTDLATRDDQLRGRYLSGQPWRETF